MRVLQSHLIHHQQRNGYQTFLMLVNFGTGESTPHSITMNPWTGYSVLYYPPQWKEVIFQMMQRQIEVPTFRHVVRHHRSLGRVKTVRTLTQDGSTTINGIAKEDLGVWHLPALFIPNSGIITHLKLWKSLAQEFGISLAKECFEHFAKSTKGDSILLARLAAIASNDGDISQVA